MSVKKVLKYGDKILRTPSKEVHKISKKVQELLIDLMDTMYAKNGVGLAAPQIGVNLRVFVIDVSTGCTKFAIPVDCQSFNKLSCIFII